MPKDNEEGLFYGYGIRISGKSGGIHEGDPHGGVYKKIDQNEAIRHLIKRDNKKPQNDIAEYLASKVYLVLAPNTGPDVNLVKDSRDSVALDANPYIASKFIDNCKDLGQPNKLDAIGGNKNMKVKLSSKESDGKYVVKDHAKCVVASLLIGDFSIHTGNFLLSNDNNLKRIDFGAAFRPEVFGAEINPMQSINNRLHLEKNYLKRGDHPSERIYNEEFSSECRCQAKVGLSNFVDQVWKDIVDKDKGFNKNTIEEFGKQFGLSKEICEATGGPGIKKYVLETLQKRQEDLKLLAVEIDIIRANNLPKDKIQEKTDILNRVYQENPEFCVAIIEKQSTSKFPQALSKDTLQKLNDCKLTQMTQNMDTFLQKIDNTKNDLDLKLRKSSSQSQGQLEKIVPQDIKNTFANNKNMFVKSQDSKSQEVGIRNRSDNLPTNGR